MARQRGLFTISGTIGDLNFFIMSGKGFVRRAGGGFNGEAIRTQDNMKLVRDNASEFGHCSTSRSRFRRALLPFFGGLKGRQIHSRLMTLFTQLKDLDFVSERGKRRVKHGLQTAKGKRLLKQFEFIPHQKMMSDLYEQSNFDWHTQQLSVKNFNPSLYKTPKAATHVGITLGVLDFDFDRLDSALEVSPTCFLAVDSLASSFVLEPADIVSPQHSGVAVLGLRYYEIIDQEVYDLQSGIAVRVLDYMD
ncbi:hypothetical protein DFQ11_1066 [Winogradskyella epiphytica]|uniref:Uncharacterized protein n=1 Tax=Winogradskyella epiphytica TaxID=262005 RepID=A0A2V4XCX3_9FLAO|nr:hypothetical protein [Winogradskyella epiphytica]PYE80209.1 hypothetical protein DFQ11_1066 [Winogradskyella epiphytica]GGW75008.1 hypothetical protein GCM10008085_28800 [Winogradskyella epiphytica]